jgi:SAM-dependent methyltransferase
LAEQFGAIDIYLFDQLLRGRIRPGQRLLDAGCGSGRNLVYLLRAGFDVAANDRDATALHATRALARRLAPHLPDERFRVEALEHTSFPEGWADVVLCSAVLHFARDDAHFEAMLRGCYKVVAPGGLFFCRLASSIGLPAQARHLAGRRYALPDGSERYLVDAAQLAEWTERLGGEWVDPLKTTLVQGQRCMTTWVIRARVPSAPPEVHSGGTTQAGG